ncbi:MAG: 1,4-alpha-glucan branching protein GlgB [Pirellulaceae bacterium]
MAGMPTDTLSSGLETTIGHQVESLAKGTCNRPLDILGWRRLKNSSDQLIVRAWNPKAQEVRLNVGDQVVGKSMAKVHDAGLFETTVSGKYVNALKKGDYQFEFRNSQQTITMPDPYAAPSMIGELDLHLFAEGNHLEIYDRLGAHVRTINGEQGVCFAVWAPNAKNVSLIGSFNDWDGRRHPMHNVQMSGVWELFVPMAKVGDAYKFRVTSASGVQTDKADPYGYLTELPPRTASVVHDLNQFHWSDSHWLNERAERNFAHEPISVYELHLGSWQQRHGRPHGWINYRDLAHEIVNYCKNLNFTHIELMPVSEHPFTGSWGYQTTGYFAATSRYGNPDDLMYFINHCHEHGIGVILDWVPAHFPKDAHGLAKFDGSCLYEHADPRQGEHPDWNTLIFNYSRNEVRNFLVANALFWFDKYHIDGLRVDAVASMLYLDYSRKAGEWIPNHLGGRENLAAIDFLKKFNEEVHSRFPGALTIAEESTAWSGVSRPTYSGGLGFSIKWNMGWMNDTLRYIEHDPVHRKFHHDELTFSLVYAFSENFMLPLSHDEVVHGKGALLSKMPGDDWQKFANLRLLYGYMWTHPGKKLLFMGGEFGQWHEWNCNEPLDWPLLDFESHSGLQHLIGDLNRLYRDEKALHDLDFDGEGFQWIDCDNRNDSSLVYARRDRSGEEVIVACNFTPMVREKVRIGVPKAGRYREILNTDSQYYGGSNLGNATVIESSNVSWSNQPHSLEIVLPPLGMVVIKAE